MTNQELRDFFAYKLSKASGGMTARELAVAADLDPTKSRHYAALEKMIELNIVEKSDTRFFITDYGLSTLKSPLAQTVETSVEIAEPAPIVEESPLEQKHKSNTAEKIDEIEAKPYPFVVDSQVDEVDIKPIVDDKSEIKDLNPKNWAVRKAIDDAAQIIISHYESQIIPPRIIDNIETKIALLTDMVEQSNNQRAKVFNMIIEDLRS